MEINMKFIKAESYEELSKITAKLICDQVRSKPDSVLGLATGSSPLGAYAEIIKEYKSGNVDFSRVTSINLDEYVGLSGDNDQSYRYFMNNNLFKHVNIDLANTNVPSGCSDDPDAECRAYDALIESVGGIDLQLLGIGLDGHIGFNEPDSYFEKATHVVTLDESTIEANARFFEKKEDVPRSAITMGMGGIMGAKKVVLIANGAAKRDILEKAFYGKITPEVPASILQLHKDLTVIYSEK